MQVQDLIVVDLIDADVLAGWRAAGKVAEAVPQPEGHPRKAWIVSSEHDLSALQLHTTYLTDSRRLVIVEASPAA